MLGQDLEVNAMHITVSHTNVAVVGVVKGIVAEVFVPDLRIPESAESFSGEWMGDCDPPRGRPRLDPPSRRTVPRLCRLLCLDRNEPVLASLRSAGHKDQPRHQ